MTFITIEDYTPAWVDRFEALRERLWPLVEDLALGIEHVGSTSVEGLAAKPVIDVDIVIAEASVLPEICERLDKAGYEFEGDKGIPERYAFRCRRPAFRHHLYVCLAGSAALQNHLCLRDHLRNHPADREAYADLKRRLAAEHVDDIDAYVRGKTVFVEAILQRYEESE